MSDETLGLHKTLALQGQTYDDLTDVSYCDVPWICVWLVTPSFHAPAFQSHFRGVRLDLPVLVPSFGLPYRQPPTWSNTRLTLYDSFISATSRARADG